MDYKTLLTGVGLYSLFKKSPKPWLQPQTPTQLSSFSLGCVIAFFVIGLLPFLLLLYWVIKHA